MISLSWNPSTYLKTRQKMNNINHWNYALQEQKIFFLKQPYIGIPKIKQASKPDPYSIRPAIYTQNLRQRAYPQLFLSRTHLSSGKMSSLLNAYLRGMQH